MARLLCEAAELEHGLMCQYLYAAFSLKRGLGEGIDARRLELIRRWEASILLVARQEMEHLALVCNLLTALGEAPYLHRPNFPINLRYAQLETPCFLEPLGLPALERFIQFEMPQNIDEDHDSQLREIFGPTYHHQRYTGIATLYNEINDLFALLSDDDLIGPGYAQLSNNPTADDKPVGGRGYEIKLDPVTKVAAGIDAIEQIVSEGEGTTNSKVKPAIDQTVSRGEETTKSEVTSAAGSKSHFARFLMIYRELADELRRDPSFEPARNVGGRMDDALPARGWAGELVTTFNLAYETLLLMLLRFIVTSDSEEDQEEAAAMQQAAFFPMMTAVIRPLGEILTRIPLGDDGYAAANFWFERPVGPLPSSQTARKVVHRRLAALAEHARRLANPGEPTPAGFDKIGQRLASIAVDLNKMERDFAARAGLRS